MNAIDSSLILSSVVRVERISEVRTERTRIGSRTTDATVLRVRGQGKIGNREDATGVVEIAIDFPIRWEKISAKNLTPIDFLLNTITELITPWHYLS